MNKFTPLFFNPIPQKGFNINSPKRTTSFIRTGKIRIYDYVPTGLLLEIHLPWTLSMAFDVSSLDFFKS